MDQIIGDHGIAGLLAGIVVMLALHIVLKLGSFMFNLLRKKHEITDKHVDNLIRALGRNVEAIQHLDTRMQAIEISLRDFEKFKLDIKRSFTAIKVLSGDKWQEIRRQVMEDN